MLYILFVNVTYFCYLWHTLRQKGSVKCADNAVSVFFYNQIFSIMGYSLNKRKMSVGPLKGKKEFVASPICQKQRISFDKLCERTAEDSTVGDADVAALFYTSFAKCSTSIA